MLPGKKKGIPHHLQWIGPFYADRQVSFLIHFKVFLTRIFKRTKTCSKIRSKLVLLCWHLGLRRHTFLLKGASGPASSKEDLFPIWSLWAAAVFCFKESWLSSVTTSMKQILDSFVCMGKYKTKHLGLHHFADLTQWLLSARGEYFVKLFKAEK